MGMGLHLSQSLQQSLSAEQRLEQTLQLLIRMDQAVEYLFGEGRDSPHKVLQASISSTLSHIREPELCAAVELALSDPALRDRVLRSPESLAIPDLQRVKQVVQDYYFELANVSGGFTFPTLDEHGAESGASYTAMIQKRWYSLAFQYAPDPHCKNPNSIESAIRKNTETVRSLHADAGGDGTLRLDGLVQEIVEAQQALGIRSNWAEPVKKHSLLLLHALLLKDELGEPLLGGCIRDLAVMRKLRFGISERLQNHFISHCHSISDRDSAQMHENGFLNVVGEYVLLSMGIVRPEIFALQRGKISEQAYLSAKETLAEQGLDIDQLCKHYKLSPCGSIFWNRYSVVGQRPSRLTDELVNRFLTETVREKRGEVLTAANYGNVVEQVKQLKGEHRSQRKDLRADLDLALRELFVDTLTGEAFSTVLLDNIRGPWYEKLAIFYGADDTPAQTLRKAVGA